MKFCAGELILIYSFIYDLVSSKLFLSHLSEVKEENDTLGVMCRDNTTGAAATWRGPKNRKLGEKTNPHVRTTIYGVQLMFDRIRKEDAGVYTCRTHLDKAEFILFVEDPIVFVDTPSVQQGEEGTDIIVKCEAKRGSITWLVDGEVPKGRYRMIGDGLLIKNATKEDAKTYICKAFGEDTGTIKDKHIELKVTHPPRLPPSTPERHYMKEEIVYGYIGGVINLTCEVEAEPPPTFRWLDKSNLEKIGEEIIGPYQSVLMVPSESPEQTNTTLNETLRFTYSSIYPLKMTPKTIGNYKCIAENQHGELEVIFKVLNGSQPNPPTSLRLKEATSDTLSLEINDPEPTEEEIISHMEPLKYRIEYRPVTGNESEDWIPESLPLAEDKIYTLTELAQTTRYEVRVATENRAGLSDFTNTTIFETSATNKINSNLLSILLINILLLGINGVDHRHI